MFLYEELASGVGYSVPVPPMLCDAVLKMASSFTGMQKNHIIPRLNVSIGYRISSINSTGGVLRKGSEHKHQHSDQNYAKKISLQNPAKLQAKSARKKKKNIYNYY